MDERTSINPKLYSLGVPIIFLSEVDPKMEKISEVDPEFRKKIRENINNFSWYGSLCSVYCLMSLKSLKHMEYETDMCSLMAC